MVPGSGAREPTTKVLVVGGLPGALPWPSFSSPTWWTLCQLGPALLLSRGLQSYYGTKATLVTSLYLHYLCKDPVLQHSHLLRHGDREA